MTHARSGGRQEHIVATTKAALAGGRSSRVQPNYFLEMNSVYHGSRHATSMLARQGDAGTLSSAISLLPPTETNTMKVFSRKRQRDAPEGGAHAGSLHREAPTTATPSIVMPRISAGGNESRLARQDLGAVSMRLDDLEYGLEGLASRSIAVQRRSACDILSLCAERKQRSMLFRASGVLPRVVGAMAGSQVSADAHVALAVASVLELVARDAAAASVAGPLVACVLWRLRL
eukprot:6342373-Prymnesium_polylepis.1